MLAGQVLYQLSHIPKPFFAVVIFQIVSHVYAKAVLKQ
jgi:hypothetical protein